MHEPKSFAEALSYRHSIQFSLKNNRNGLINYSFFSKTFLNLKSLVYLRGYEPCCCPSKAAIWTCHGSPRHACDSVRVNISTAAPGQRDVILVCDSDWQHMASTTQACPTARFVQLALLGFSCAFAPPSTSIKPLLETPAQGSRTPAQLFSSPASLHHTCWAQ